MTTLSNIILNIKIILFLLLLLRNKFQILFIFFLLSLVSAQYNECASDSECNHIEDITVNIAIWYCVLILKLYSLFEQMWRYIYRLRRYVLGNNRWRKLKLVCKSYYSKKINENKLLLWCSSYMVLMMVALCLRMTD